MTSSTASIPDSQQRLVDELASIPDWQDRYRRIIQIGRDLPALPDDLRDEKHKVRGCQSQVWLHARLDGDRVRFAADADSAIVRGLVAMLVYVFDDHPPRDIIAAPVDFLDRIGLAENLSQTRANGVAAMIKQIRAYAVAFDAIQRAGR